MFWSVALSLAVLAAPVVVYLAYRLMFPVNAARRWRMHRAAMVRDVEDMARAVASGGAHVTIWRARLYHRLLRAIRLAERNRLDVAAAAEQGLRLLNLAAVVLILDRLRKREDMPAPACWAMHGALLGIAGFAASPTHASEALREAAARLPPEAERDARRLAESAEAMPEAAAG